MRRILVLESIHAAGIERLRQFAQVEFLLNRPRAEVLSRLAEADAVVCKSVTRVDREFLAAAPRLKVVGRAGSGTDNFDKGLLKERGIPLLTVPTGNSISAAEFAVMCILLLAKNAVQAVDAVRGGDFRRDLLEGRELSCMTVGVVGFGNVGRAVAERLAAFGCRVMVFDLRPEKNAAACSLGFTPAASVEDILGACDVVTLHATLDETSQEMINRATLAKARPGLLLVNAARGALMRDADVLEALDSGQVAALAIDTLAPEPPYNAAPGDHAYAHPYLGHPRVVVFPHMAASTSDAQERIALTLAEDMRRALEAAEGQEGKP